MSYITFQPNDYFNTKLYTGNGTDDHAITGVGFQPDFVWHKIRSGADNHGLYDAIRGATKNIQSNSDLVEQTTSTGLKSFDSDGFTLGTNSEINGNSSTYSSWNWKANGSGSANTDGSISSTVSANTTSGFSIVTYTGTGNNATIGHSLNAVPKMIIVKNLTNANAWSVYHASLGATKYLALNETDAVGTASDRWQDTTPTSSVFSIGTNANQGGSYNYVAYCFAQKSGFSSMGSYVGNGSSDGPFIYTNGMKPAFVLIKDYGRAESWYIFDNRRLGYNGAMADFLANTTAAESSSSATLLDFVSNGFKLRGTTDHLNGNGQNFLYMAFAEEPIVSSNGVPATAR